MTLAPVCCVILNEPALHIMDGDLGNRLWECNLVEVQFPSQVKVKGLQNPCH